MDESLGDHQDGKLLVSVVTTVCIAHVTTGLDLMPECDCQELAEVLEFSYKVRPNEERLCPAYEALLRHISTDILK